MSDDSPFSGVLRDLRRLASGDGPPIPPIAPPHGGEEDPGMEGRVKRLEDDVRAIRGDLTAVLVRLGAIEGRLGGLEGEVRRVGGQMAQLAGQMNHLSNQVIAKMPSGLQLFGLMISTLAAGTAILGAAIALGRYLKLIP